MATTIRVVVIVIGWNPRSGEPRALRPQFVSPVAARIYTTIGIRHAPAWLRLDGTQIVATVRLPDGLRADHVRCFCCTVREYEPKSHLDRRRITSVDLVVASRLEHISQQPVEDDEDDDRSDAAAAKLAGAIPRNEASE